MDRLDVRILRTLLQEPAYVLSPEVRKSFGAIARKVRADEGTVRNRIRKLHESGFIGDWRLTVNPRLTGGGWVGEWFEVPSNVSKSRLIEDLKLLPGVIVIITTYGSLVWVSFKYENEPAMLKQVEVIRRMAGAEKANVARIPFPECTIVLSTSDWSLLKAVYRDPRRTYASVAKEVSLSSRTVRRRLRRMIDGYAVFGFPALHPKGLRGSTMASLLVTYPLEHKGKIDASVASVLDDYLFHVLHMMPLRPHDPAPCSYNLALPNVPKGREILDAVRQLPDVQTARLELMETVHTMFEPLEADIVAKTV